MQCPTYSLVVLVEPIEPPRARVRVAKSTVGLSRHKRHCFVSVYVMSENEPFRSFSCDVLAYLSFVQATWSLHV